MINPVASSPVLTRFRSDRQTQVGSAARAAAAEQPAGRRYEGRSMSERAGPGATGQICWFFVRQFQVEAETSLLASWCFHKFGTIEMEPTCFCRKALVFGRSSIDCLGRAKLRQASKPVQSYVSCGVQTAELNRPAGFMGFCCVRSGPGSP